MKYLKDKPVTELKHEESSTSRIGRSQSRSMRSG